MDSSLLAKLLAQLNANLADPNSVEEVFCKNYEETSNILNCSFDHILKNIVPLINISSITAERIEYKYVCLNFYILELLNGELSKLETNVLSVQETKDVKSALKNLVLHGVLKNLQPKLPHRVMGQNYDISLQENVLYKYDLLRSTVIGFHNCLKYPNIRMLILPHCLQGILVAVFQIAFCPLKKPDKNNENSTFVMSDELYMKFVQDQNSFKNILENMSKSIHPSIFIKETMVLFQANAPIWFKKTIANTLTKMIRSKKGVQNVALAMFDVWDDDTTKTWKTLDVFLKLIMSCRIFSDFRENICVQVLDLLSLTKSANSEVLVFERLVVSCTKSLSSEDEEVCKEVFVNKITSFLSKFDCKDHQFCDGEDITDDTNQSARLLYGCFVDSSDNVTCLPINLLRSFINIIFYFYHLTLKSRFQTANRELKELLIKCLQDCTTEEIHQLLDNFLFGFTVAGISQFRDDVIVEVDEKIMVKKTPHVIIYATADVTDTVYNLLTTDHKIILFGYLLKCITNKEKYFINSHNSKELLGNEEHATSTVLERLLTIHKLLMQLSESKNVQRSLGKKPDDIIEYMNKVLCSNADSQLIFILLMILDNLVTNATKNIIFKYKVLVTPLSVIAEKATDMELKSLCRKIINSLKENKVQVEIDVTEFEKALEDVYDPLLPTRGHGLLVLSKLIEKRDKQAMERKQYLLNLFQLYLKDEDSFIYLNAVQGLAALADIFPETIIEVLCEEYGDFSKKTDSAQENRMKLGEVLVKIVKLLGEMAPKYKSILLNTFLSGIRDDDHLIRASSLSNLGEVCRVLNYKLGTIVTEVLVAVHAVITTDNAVEARRAAVTVIRQLFIGLQSEMIAFLKEEILPIYRTLKEIYYNDKDDVMRLQAQLALEELNENMKDIVFPNPQLHHTKKIITLD